MGRGDGRSRRGKIFKGSYGNTRKHKVKSAVPTGKTAVKKVTGVKKAPATKKAK